MKIPILGRVFDERFLNHRLKSTSLGGIIGGALAMGLFAYHYYHDHIWSWDLLAVGITMVLVKWIVLTWYLIND
jgi:hypothetical protein